MKRIAVLVSGGGSNLQALLAAIDGGQIDGEVALVLSSRKSAYALTRARERGIPALFLSKKEDPSTYDARMLALLTQHDIDLIVLAGFLGRLEAQVLSRYGGHILNIHPALLPSFGGQGMYGSHVHEAVLQAGCRVSGATVHLVTERYDEGPIVLQRAVDVLEGDTPDTLAARVLAAEHLLLPAAVALYCRGALRVEGGKVTTT